MTTTWRGAAAIGFVATVTMVACSGRSVRSSDDDAESGRGGSGAHGGSGGDSGNATGGKQGYGGSGVTGGFGAIGGDLGGTGTGGCREIREMWAAGGCGLPADCIDPKIPSAEYVTMNQPADENAGEGPGGAGGEAGAPGSGGALVAAAALCALDEGMDPPISHLALDFLMPETVTVLPGYAIYGGGPCSGTKLAEVWLSDYYVPEPGSWTTQCVELPGPVTAIALSVAVMDPGARVRNVRFVQGCECNRERIEQTTCNYGPQGHGGGSNCAGL